MKINMFLMMVCATLLVSGVAMADNQSVYPNNYSVNEYHPDTTVRAANPWRFGFSMDLGVPSGAAVGLVLHPREDWLTVDASFTYLVGPGGRLSVKLDPMALIPHFTALGLFADVQGGFMAQSSIPGHSSDLPSVGWDYVNLYGGLRLGNPGGFHWLFEAGPTYLHVNTSNFQSLVNSAGGSGVVIGNPSVNGWFVPTFMTGFEATWDIR